MAWYYVLYLGQDILFITDLRDSSSSTCVPIEEIERKSKEGNVTEYFETSSMINVGVCTAIKLSVRTYYISMD